LARSKVLKGEIATASLFQGIGRFILFNTAIDRAYKQECFAFLFNTAIDRAYKQECFAFLFNTANSTKERWLHHCQR
jgi:hypothetical protein